MGNSGENLVILGRAGLTTWEENSCDAARGILSAWKSARDTPDARWKDLAEARSQSFKPLPPITRQQHHVGQ
ncbi:MAG: hypothetical protein FJ118_03915 [Deltaproteobacteria bacterium]|nr:hypothetical protein [Deltaproteobacteria bacterium]